MISKDESNVIKGIAIILMVTHHLFAFPSWWVEGVLIGNMPCYSIANGSILKIIAESGRICIALFAMVSGYGLYKKYDKSKKYLYKSNVKGLGKLVVPYWITLFLFVVIGYSVGNVINVNIVMENFLLIDFSLNPFAWYVRFYVLVILSFPLILLFIKGLKACRLPGILVMVVVSGISTSITKLIGYENTNRVCQILYEYFLYIPFVIVGMCCAAYKWMEKFEAIRSNHAIGWGIISCLSIAGILVSRTWLFHGNLRVDPYLVLIMVGAIIGVSRWCGEDNCINQSLAILGKNSLGIWLYHSVFFFILPQAQYYIYGLKISCLQLIAVLLIGCVYSMFLNKCLHIFSRDRKGN